jgi:hypothetical protein
MLSIEENVHLVCIKYLKELFDETGNSSSEDNIFNFHVLIIKNIIF